MKKKGELSILFGGNVRRLRERRAYTQEQLAERSGLHWTYIGGVERGERNPTLKTAERIAHALATPLVKLLQ